MVECCALREAFTDFRHRDCRQNDGVDAELAERGCERQRVDDGGQHAHMVAGDTVATLGRHGDTAENIAAADDNADFNAHRPRFGNIGGDPVCNRHIDTETLVAHKGFTGSLEKNTFVDRLGRHHDSSEM